MPVRRPGMLLGVVLVLGLSLAAIPAAAVSPAAPERPQADGDQADGDQADRKGTAKKADKKKPDDRDQGDGDSDERRTQEQKEKDKEVRRVEAFIKDALRRGSLDEVAQLIEHLGSLGTRRAIDISLRLGETYTGDPIRSAVMNALVWSRHKPECMSYYLNQIERWKRVRVERLILLVDALDAIEGEESNAGLIQALGVTDERVVTGAVRALRHKPTRESVQAAILLFGKIALRHDLLAAETRITLITLTGEKYESYEDWANWWLINKDTWKPRPSKDQVAERRARTAVYRPERDYEIPKLFGQEVASKRVVFVIDCSSSMAKEDPWEGEEGTVGGSRIRIERAKKELVRVVTELRPDVFFNIVAYNTYASIWKKDKLVPASKANKRQAVRFIGSWKPEGHTNTLEAMQLAMEFSDLDTVILLSDGSPTIPGVGSLADIPPILEAIRQDNRFKKITIHTLGFPGCKVSFMKDLAKDSHGTYAEIK